MPLSAIIRRASTFILGGDDLDDNYKNTMEDNEILFCKNNVCVHPPAPLRHDTDLHQPGYLTISTKIFVEQHNATKRPTLFLSWIPNASLAAIRHDSMESLASDGSGDSRSTNPFLDDDRLIHVHVEIASPEIGVATAASTPILPPSPQPTTPRYRRRFGVDLSQMRSLRLFFSDDACTCGQLVVASRESQYKILHFHHGGLDHLAQVLHQWHSLLHSIRSDNLPYKHFMVCRPEVTDVELHPEEGHVVRLSDNVFRCLFGPDGRLDDDLTLRKIVFFAGMERDLRRHVWPFLLHVYPYQSTYLERAQIVETRRIEYEEITRRRTDMQGAQLNQFKRKIQSVIDKDVVRTDRGNPFFAGDSNPNLDVMRCILLNYAVYNPTLGYTQGMSDLLAPVLCELRDEVGAFWCFVGLMQRAVFVATPTDRDMDRSLRYLRELIRMMVPKFDQHLIKHKDAGELLFCHRWILLCFKREFTEPVALRMWEACWANYLTDYFHLFLCLAIICVYADDVIAQDLRADEMLLHFSSLAMYMDGMLIMRKARGLLHQFRQLREIPCTLSGLCTRCGPGIWDSSHSPRIYCVGHENTGRCSDIY